MDCPPATNWLIILFLALIHRLHCVTVSSAPQRTLTCSTAHPHLLHLELLLIPTLAGTPPPSTPPPTSAPPSPPPQIVLPSPSLVTETVFGFLDFVTTVGNTVMVFTPANAGEYDAEG